MQITVIEQSLSNHVSKRYLGDPMEWSGRLRVQFELVKIEWIPTSSPSHHQIFSTAADKDVDVQWTCRRCQMKRMARIAILIRQVTTLRHIVNQRLNQVVPPQVLFLFMFLDYAASFQSSITHDNVRVMQYDSIQYAWSKYDIQWQIGSKQRGRS